MKTYDFPAKPPKGALIHGTDNPSSPLTVATAIVGCWIAILLLNIWLLPRQYAVHVEIKTLKMEPMPLVVRASGNLEAKLSLTAKAQFDGPILKKAFREGQPVKKGQLLLMMSQERIRLDYQTKFDALQNAKADLIKARKDLKLQKALFEKQAVAYSSVEDAQTDLVKKTQALHSAEEASKLELLQWNSAKIFAPFNGTIVKDLLGDDKFVKADRELFIVADVSQYTVKARVDELDIKRVHEGQKATIRLQIYDDTPLPAFVKEVGSAPEGAGLPEVPVVLSLSDTKNLQLRPKLTAECRIFTGVTEPILSVPSEAVSNNEGEPRVWVVGLLNKIHAVPVTLGRTNPDYIEVTQGLQPGQQVCASAEPEFADGMRIVPDAAPASGASKTHALLRTLKKSGQPDKRNPHGSGARS